MTDINMCKELRNFISGKVQGNSFRPPIRYKPRKQAFWCTRSFHGLVWKSVCSDYKELLNLLPRDVKCGYFAKRTEKCLILSNLRGKVV